MLKFVLKGIAEKTWRLFVVEAFFLSKCETRKGIWESKEVIFPYSEMAALTGERYNDSPQQKTPFLITVGSRKSR